MGFELFYKSSCGQTEFDEKVNYQRALEGELERTIQTLSGVKSARVHLVMPTSSVFLDRERGAKASVTLRMKRGTLAPEQLNAISRLVSGAVDDLSPHDVAIIDADSNEALGAKSGTLEGRELEAELSKRLLATLGPALGAENLRTSVNVEYDMSSSEESQDKYDPAVSAVLSSQKTSEQVGAGAGVGGVAGTASNLPNATAPAANTPTPDDGAQLSSSDNSTFGVNKVVRHTSSPAGRIRRITAAVLVNDAVERKQVKGKWLTAPHKRTPQQLEQIADLARGVLGADSARGDVVTVQNLTFDDPESAYAPATLMDKVQNSMRQFGTPLRYAAMLLLFALVWALMIRPVQNQVIASMKELPAATVSAPLLQASPAGTAELAAGAVRTALQDEVETTRMKRELSDLVQSEPASMTRTLQSWLREDHA